MLIHLSRHRCRQTDSYIAPETADRTTTQKAKTVLSGDWTLKGRSHDLRLMTDQSVSVHLLELPPVAHRWMCAYVCVIVLLRKVCCAFGEQSFHSAWQLEGGVASLIGLVGVLGESLQQL